MPQEIEVEVELQQKSAENIFIIFCLFIAKQLLEKKNNKKKKHCIYFLNA